MARNSDSERFERIAPLLDQIPPFSRRDFLGYAAGAALAAGWLGRVRRAAAQGQAASGGHQIPEITAVAENLKGAGEVRVATWGGIGTEMQRVAFYEPFTRLTGIKVVEASGPSVAKIRAMVETKNVEWDVCQSSRGAVMELEALGDYFLPIDYGLVDTAGIAARYRDPKALDFLPYAQIYAYRSDVFPVGKAPQSWGDFWDAARFPGPRTLPTATDGNYPELVGALIADGVAPDKVYPIDIDRAYKSLDRIRPQIVKWWNTGAMPLQMLTDKEAVMAGAWNARVAALQADKVPIEIVWNGGTLFSNAWAVPKGAPNRDNAMKFIGFTTTAVAQARYSMLLPYGYTNDKAAALIPADIARTLPTAPDNLKQLVPQDVPWWVKHRAEVIERWTTWVLK